MAHPTSRAHHHDDRPWGEADLRFLENAAGKLSAASVAAALARTEDSVERTARALGTTLAPPVRELAWCDRCATWRTSVSARTGWCRVCSLRDRIVGREEACAEALAAMAPQDRRTYEDTEAERGSKRLPPAPRMRLVSPSAAGRTDEEAAYLAAMEEWEHQVLKLRYDAVKTRLRRMREKTGANPRKGAGRNAVTPSASCSCCETPAPSDAGRAAPGHPSTKKKGGE
ncbi:hypothetical protein [Arabiibacter massiliensis]|uniref:hypothetical protein n=1 Tax=Arabiibacter massiliensis TaxID=1870985 RepID=UPI0009BABA22|nr:hypothetical protein [Arabiibacter massiliensis]